MDNETTKELARQASGVLEKAYDDAELCRLYVNLLVASMDKEKRGNAHPSFVNLIGQMTPDGAKTMACFAAGEGRLVPASRTGATPTLD